MKLGSRQGGAVYLNSRDAKALKKPKASGFSLLLTLGLALFIFASTLSVVYVTPTNNVALAEDCNPSQGENNCDFEEGTDDFNASQDDADKAAGSAYAPDGEIPYLLWRLLRIGYLNEGEDAVIPGDDDDPRYGKRWNCSTDESENSNQGTLLYHNCDVPNFLTEVVQGFAQSFIPSGPQNANQESAYAGKVEKDEGARPWGLSYYTPKNVSVNSRVKFTGLEMFGYNMKYTSYKGEWDYIQIYTSARALAGFSTFDKVKLIFQAGIAAIGNFVVGTLCFWCDDDPPKPGTKVIIDTSDTNVFTQKAWYRPNFGASMYGVRELSEAEVSELILFELTDQLNSDEAAEQYPEFDDIVPLKDINLGSCSWRGETAPASAGIYTRGACFQFFKDYPNPPASRDKVTFEAPETIAAWRARVWGDAADEYNLCGNVNVNVDWSNPTAAVNEIDNIKSGCITSLNEKFLELLAEIRTSGLGALGLVGTPADVIEGMIAKQQGKYIQPANRYICLDENGKDRVRESEVGRDYYYFLYNEKGNEVNPDCYEGGVQFRAPIQNGLFGNGYLDKIYFKSDGDIKSEAAQPARQLENIIDDPRREQFDPGFFDTLLRGYTPTNVIANVSLSVTKLTTKVSNTVLNLALSPILEQIGLRDIIIDMIGALRDSVFYPLIILIIAFAGIMIFADTLRKRNYLQQLQSIILLALTFISAVILLEKPETTIDFVDKAPSYVEAVIVGTIFEVDSDDRDNVCKASDASGVTAEKGWEGENLPFNPKASSRMILCENWRTFLLNPYVYGQWGVPYDALDEENMQNQNENLVGSPIVRLGGGTDSNSSATQNKYWEKNWALYQLDSTLTGTTTVPDNSNPNDAVSREFYRIVDMQAHPAMDFDKIQVGEPDDRYFDMWAGNDISQRAIISFLGAILSFMGMVVVVIYAFAKITATLLTTLMLVFLPFIFMVGVVPGGGRSRMKQYFGTIISLMFQRVMLTVLLALMMKIMTIMAASATNFYMYFVLGMAICAMFIMYRNELIGLFTKTTKEALGGWRDYATNQNGAFINRSVDQYIRQQKYVAGGMITGATGGFMAGGVDGARKGVAESVKTARMRSNIADRREGTGLYRAMKNAGTEGQKAGTKEFDKYSGLATHAIKDRLEKPEASGLDRFATSPKKIIEDEVGKSHTSPKGRRAVVEIGKQVERRNKKAEKFEDSPYNGLTSDISIYDQAQLQSTDESTRTRLVNKNFEHYDNLFKANDNLRKAHSRDRDQKIEKLIDKSYKSTRDMLYTNNEQALQDRALREEADRMSRATFADTDSQLWEDD